MWTASALASDTISLSGQVWRVVEHQYTVSTRKLVGTQSDQAILEEILEESKPPVPQGAEHLNFLLQAPFRYDAPYPVGSRFRRSGSTEGVFYASEEIRTALSEFSHYRLQFYKESPDTYLPRNQERLTVYSVDYSSDLSIDLMQAPYVQDRAIWTSPRNYVPTQDFADIARDGNIEVIRYESVRDKPSANIAILSPTALTSSGPESEQTWFFYLSQSEVNCERSHASDNSEILTFSRDQLIQ